MGFFQDWLRSNNPASGRVIKESGDVVNVADMASDIYNGDSNINTKILSSTGRPFASDPHSIVHEGRMFEVSTFDPDVSASINNGANLDLVIIPGEGNNPHVDASYNLGGAGYIATYELDPEQSITGGTELSAVNNKFYSETVFNGTILLNPSLSLTGATYKGGAAIVGTSQGQTRTGGSGDFALEHIIRSGYPYLIRLHNSSGGSVRGSMNAVMYNSGLIQDAS